MDHNKGSLMRKSKGYAWKQSKTARYILYFHSAGDVQPGKQGSNTCSSYLGGVSTDRMDAVQVQLCSCPNTGVLFTAFLIQIQITVL